MGSIAERFAEIIAGTGSRLSTPWSSNASCGAIGGRWARGNKGRGPGAKQTPSSSVTTSCWRGTSVAQ